VRLNACLDGAGPHVKARVLNRDIFKTPMTPPPRAVSWSPGRSQLAACVRTERKCRKISMD